MRLLRDVIADPPDIILAGAPFEMIGVGLEAERAWSAGTSMNAPVPFEPVEVVPPRIETMLFKASVQDAVAPMIVAGALQRLPIAKVPPPSPVVEVIERLLADQLILSTESMVASVPEPNFMGCDIPSATAMIPEPMLPRKELAGNPFRSIGKTDYTTPLSRADFGPTVDNTAWVLSGTTLDGATGAVVASVMVCAQRTGWMYAGGPGVIAETISDGSGAYRLILPNTDHLLVGYKSGPPDLSGTTRNDATPVTAGTIYMRDPTTANSGGGGGSVGGGLRHVSGQNMPVY